jgi:Domain of unknown function (DUF4260)
MHVAGRPRAFLRFDGLVLLVATVIIFATVHEPWWLYPALVLAPDLSMVGYLASSRTGAALYNLGHSYGAPGVLLLIGWRSSSPLSEALGLIWLGHIGMDRLLGYGLKYDETFTATHLGEIGPASRGGRHG